jgi:hypothetical protein
MTAARSAQVCFFLGRGGPVAGEFWRPIIIPDRNLAAALTVERNASRCAPDAASRPERVDVLGQPNWAFALHLGSSGLGSGSILPSGT